MSFQIHRHHEKRAYVLGVEGENDQLRIKVYEGNGDPAELIVSTSDMEKLPQHDLNMENGNLVRESEEGGEWAGKESTIHDVDIQQSRSNESSCVATTSTTMSTDESKTSSSDESEFQDSTNKVKKFDEEVKTFVGGLDDGSGRRKVTNGATTVGNDVMCGISSIHETATYTVLERQAELDQGFYASVQTMVSDQEFMPTLHRKFFLNLHTEERIPFVLSFAMGRVHKNMVTSKFRFYKPIFDDLVKAQGVM